MLHCEYLQHSKKQCDNLLNILINSVSQVLLRPSKEFYIVPHEKMLFCLKEQYMQGLNPLSGRCEHKKTLTHRLLYHRARNISSPGEVINTYTMIMIGTQKLSQNKLLRMYVRVCVVLECGSSCSSALSLARMRLSGSFTYFFIHNWLDCSGGLVCFVCPDRSTKSLISKKQGGGARSHNCLGSLLTILKNVPVLDSQLWPI